MILFKFLPSGSSLGKVFASCLLLYSQLVSAQNYSPLPTTELSIGHLRITAEVANTASQRSQGLMFRLGLAPNSGMVFVFDEAQQRCFWMRDTLIDLAIAYIDANARIVSLHEMRAADEHSICSLAPAMYALEMNKDWFKQHKIRVGDRVDGLPANRH